MAYLSEENSEIYNRLLSADDERGPSGANMFNPTPRTAAPSVIATKIFKSPGQMATKAITITGTTGKSSGGGVTEVPPIKTMPTSIVTTMPATRNFMPLVYLGGAGLLLYFLFKK